MSDRVEAMKSLAEMFLGRFDNATKDLKEKEIEWRPVEEANNIKWILTHLSQEWNVGIPRIIRGDQSYTPKGWPDDYVGNTKYSLEKLMGDLKKGREEILSEISKLKPADLDADITMRSGTRKRSFGLLLYLSEIVHHEGQIAYIRGAINRRRQKDSHFLV